MPDSHSIQDGIRGLVSTARRHIGRMSDSPIESDLAPYRKIERQIEAINLEHHSDAELRDISSRLRLGARSGENPERLLVESFSLTREACRRVLGLSPFATQILAGIALHREKLVQMQTGEGKTLAAVFPASLRAFGGRGVHVFTANDYLARRDAEWMGPVYRFLGLDAGFVEQGMPPDGRRRAYGADVTYLTAKEAGFDFLRDQARHNPQELVQRPFHFAIVDEADFILIDEARVPLVIAGPAPFPEIDWRRMTETAGRMRPTVDFGVDEHGRNVALTETGIGRAEALLKSGRLHRPENHLLLTALNIALHARILLHRDKDYIVRNGRIELVDEFTGRVAENRRWPHGIHPAVEAKEKVTVQPEGMVLGSIAIQHFVRLYPGLAGMTATAVPAADEFREFYGLRTVVIPPHRPCIRLDEPDRIFSHRQAKLEALLDEIARVQRNGRPILVGTASVGESEEIARRLRGLGVRCHVLNARRDNEEARIVARAGMLGTVTISTNMAGRGTDIVLGGGNAHNRKRVMELGGLYVIGTNRHETRRIDDQLRGRAGRQGDPGSSRFFISLEDDLMERYAVIELIPPKHRPPKQAAPLSNRLVAREIDRGQRIIEGQNFEIRRTLWLYSAAVEKQRQIVSVRRQALLTQESKLRETTLFHLDRYWAEHLARVDDIREGIHLQRYGGRIPVEEFQRQIFGAFGIMMRSVDRDAAESLRRISGGGKNPERARPRGPATTWTYLVNDNPFSDFGFSLIAGRNIGFSAVAGLAAVQHLPITLILLLSRLFRKKKSG